MQNGHVSLEDERIIAEQNARAQSSVFQDYKEVKRHSSEIESAVAIITQWRAILNARLIAIISLLGALGVFSFTVYDPTSLRIWAASLYSVGVLWPSIALYFRRG